MSLLLDLPKHVEQQMEAYVAAGEFRSAAEVVEAAMGLLIDRMAHEKLRMSIQNSVADNSIPPTSEVISGRIIHDDQKIAADEQHKPRSLADMLRDYDADKIKELTKDFLLSPRCGRELI